MISNGIHPQQFYHMPVDWGHSGVWGTGHTQTDTHRDTNTQTPPHTHARMPHIHHLMLYGGICSVSKTKQSKEKRAWAVTIWGMKTDKRLSLPSLSTRTRLRIESGCKVGQAPPSSSEVRMTDCLTWPHVHQSCTDVGLHSNEGSRKWPGSGFQKLIQWENTIIRHTRCWGWGLEHQAPSLSTFQQADASVSLKTQAWDWGSSRSVFRMVFYRSINCLFS